MSYVRGGSKIGLVIVLLYLAALPLVQAQDAGDLDNQKWRVEGNWWFTHPTGYFGLNGSNNYVNFNQDFGFQNNSTFTGKIDYRFRHKHHWLLNVTPIYESRTATLNRTIMFDGQTFDVGGQVNANLRSWNVAPGYEYDIIRRDHGFLGLEVDVNLIDTRAALSASASAGGSGVAISGSRSVFAPLPAVGPVFRWYPLNSNRLSIEGSVRGMPFFGYGNYLQGQGGVNIGLTKHLMLRGGYQLGSRLSIHGTADQIAVKLTHSGPTAGLEYSWGEAPPPREKVPNQPSNWHVDWIPFYLWFSGLQGSVGAAGQVVPVDVSFSDVFQRLNIGYMTDLDVRYKRVGLLTDLIFMSVSSDQQTTPVETPFYSGFTANAKQFILDPELYFRVIERDRGSIDVVAGGRFWHLNNSIDLLAGTQPATSVGQTQFWVDPVVGARFRLNLAKGFFISLKGDAGGFGVGSKATYQIYTGVGKEFKKKYSAMLGYRYLDVNYQNLGFTYDVHMNGALAGFNIRFK